VHVHAIVTPMPAPIPDFSISPATMRRPASLREALKGPFWSTFEEIVIREIFQRGGLIIDIGGGLRLDPDHGDRVNAHRQKLFGRFLSDPNVRYRVTDYTDQYHPDFVEDIHQLSFADSSVDGLFCMAVLEHVYDPKRAAEEICRVLKSGAVSLLYVPFVYRYHATVTADYRDYYRYSKDAIAYLFRRCSEIDICPVRGLFESLARFTPLHRIGAFRWLLRCLDWGTKRMRDVSQLQTSGYFIRIKK